MHTPPAASTRPDYPLLTGQVAHVSREELVEDIVEHMVRSATEPS